MNSTESAGKSLHHQHNDVQRTIPTLKFFLAIGSGLIAAGLGGDLGKGRENRPKTGYIVALHYDAAGALV